MLRLGRQRVTSNLPGFESQLGRATTYKVQRKLYSLGGWGGGGGRDGKHPTKSPAPTLATPTNFSLGCQLPAPGQPQSWETVPILKESLLPEPWERMDLEQKELARCDGKWGRGPLTTTNPNGGISPLGRVASYKTTEGAGAGFRGPRLSLSGSQPEQKVHRPTYT